MTVNRKADIRDLKAPTWKDVLVAVMRSMPGAAKLEDIYAAVAGHKRTASNPQSTSRPLNDRACRNTRFGVWEYMFIIQ